MKKLFYILILFSLLSNSTAFGGPSLSSLPGAKATIFLDFDGHYVHASSWNGGVPFYCSPSGLNDAQITEIFHRVSEDYRPFNINITTDSTAFLKAPLSQRIRIIVTLTSAWYQGVGGVSFTGSFVWGDDTPAFVFPDRLANNPKIIADCCTHESGHTVGLSHQAKYNGSCNLVTVYNDGLGSGQTGWAPVMGNSYKKNISGWNNGPTPAGCDKDQDNLSIITTKNGFTYRTDDHSDDPDVNPTKITVTDSKFLENGIITTNTDKDVFEFNFMKGGILHLDAKPFSVGPDNDGANVDLQVTLLNSEKQVLKIYDPEDILNVVVDTILNAGIYYIIVQGAGNANTSNYGSLGAYTISGSYEIINLAPVKSVSLTGYSDNQAHRLKWDIVSDVPVKNILLESSADGTIFSALSTFSTGVKEFNYTAGNEKVFYRLKVIPVKGEEAYSNIISLTSSNKTTNPIAITSVAQPNIKVSAPSGYRYQVSDLSGRIVKNGNGYEGINSIDISTCPNGIYFLQVICNSQRTTQRILKL